jgi:hypothetical protein
MPVPAPTGDRDQLTVIEILKGQRVEWSQGSGEKNPSANFNH